VVLAELVAVAVEVVVLEVPHSYYVLLLLAVCLVLLILAVQLTYAT
jgi:hypothetical protein